jgi:hypothetical protein
MPYTYLCDAIRIAKASHRKGIANRKGDSTESHKHVNLCRKGIAKVSHHKGIANKEGDSTESHKHVNLCRKGIAKVSHHKGIPNKEGDSTESHKHVNLCRKGFGGEGARVLTNATLRPRMPPCPSLWVVFGTSFTRSATLRNFNGGSPTSSTTD